MNTKTQAILMIGTQRSGSNLLRVMLNQSSSILAPHPPHILKIFHPLLPYYGNLNEVENFTQLTSDIIELIKVNPIEWVNFPINKDILLQNFSKKPTLFNIFDHIYATYALNSSKTHWCCKSLCNLHFFDQLELSLSNPKYIHIYRDGRDVALSFQKVPIGHKHFYFIAQQWKKDQEIALNIQKLVGKERFFAIKYENLVKQPKQVLQSLCDFLSVPFELEMLQYFDSYEAQNSAKSDQQWQNLSKSIISSNTQKYLLETNSYNTRIFESVADDMLEILCYQSSKLTKLNINENDVKQFEIENQQKKLIAQQNLSDIRLARNKLIDQIKTTLTNAKPQ